MWHRVSLLLFLVILAGLPALAGADSLAARIAYVQDGFVYVCGEDGGNPVRVSPQGEYSSLRWSPDGKRIACLNKVGGSDLPCVVITESAKVVTAKGVADGTSIPSWSSDSGSIVFSCREGAVPGMGRPLSAIYTYSMGDGKLKMVVKPAKLDHPAPIYLPTGEIAYADDASSEIVVYDLTAGTSRRVKAPEHCVASPAFLALEMTPFADCVVVRTEGEESDYVTAVPLFPNKPSWLPGVLGDLCRLLVRQGFCPEEFRAAYDGKSAYIVLNNTADTENNAVARSTAYRLDEHGSHLLVRISGERSVSEVAPLGPGRVIYLRRSSGGSDGAGSLRIYNLTTKSSRALVSDVSTSAVWTGE